MRAALTYIRDNTTIRTTSKHVTSFATEGLLQHKMVSALAEFFGNAERHASRLAKRTPPAQAHACIESAENISLNIADEAANTIQLEHECSLFKSCSGKQPTTEKNVVHSLYQGEYVPFNFTPKAHQRLEQPWRAVPLYILNDIIENPLHVKLDQRGHSNAYMYYARIWKNGKLYNAEVLYDATTNTISHFLYRREPLGPLRKVKNNV